jgi:exodeoxyribonuclease-1
MLVYDLRHDPTIFLKMKTADLAEAWKYSKDPKSPRLPVKVLRYNRCPAIAPIGVLSEENKKRLVIDEAKLDAHKKLLNKEFFDRVLEALGILDAQRSEQTALIKDSTNVDSLLYEQFLNDHDRNLCFQVMASSPSELSGFAERFKDERMQKLIPLYKARNFPSFLTQSEQEQWEDYRTQRLKQQLPGFVARLQALGQTSLSAEQTYILQELQLYAESIVPQTLVD